MNFLEINLSCKQMSYKLIFNNSKNRNQTEQIICYNKHTTDIYSQSETKRVGTFLIDFMNNFYRIQNEFIEFIHYIKNLEDFEINNLYIYRNELASKLKNLIPNETELMLLTLDTFLYDIRYDYNKINFLTLLQELKHNNGKEEYLDILDNYIFEFDKYFQDNINTEHYDNEDLFVNVSTNCSYRGLDINHLYQTLFLNFLSKYQKQLENLYFYITETFSNKNNKSINAKRFTGIPLDNAITTNGNNQYAICLPNTETFFEIYYNSNHEPKPDIIRYNIRHFSDFIFCSLYNILQAKVAISKCNYCEKYFITCLNNKEHFCPILDNVGNYKIKKVYTYTEELNKIEKEKVISECEKLYIPKKIGRQQIFENQDLTAIIQKLKKRINREKKTEKALEEQQVLLGINREIERRHHILKEMYAGNTEIIEKELLNFADNLINSFEGSNNNKRYGNKNAMRNKS